MRIVCLHANLNNREIVENALQTVPLERIHKVDEELLSKIQDNEDEEMIKEYVEKQLDELMQYQPDAILVTCTNYIVFIEKIQRIFPIPILQIDEILFEQLPQTTSVTVLFTNEKTISGTTARLSRSCPWLQEINIVFIDEVFEWYLRGDLEAHHQRIIATLKKLATTEMMIAPQLSMGEVIQLCNEKYQQQIFSSSEALKKHFSVFHEHFRK